MSDIHVAGPADAPALAALVNAAFVVESFFKTGDRTSADEILRMMETGQFLVLGPRGGRFVACAYLRIERPRASFAMLSVDPAQQGRGAGRLMVDALERRARDAGCYTMEIQVVNLRHELPPFYRQWGYEEAGTIPFPEDPAVTQPCHFIVMRKRLEADGG